MNRMVCTALAAGLLLMATGCAHNVVFGHDSTRMGVFFGSLGMKGNGNTVTVQNGSKLTKVSFWGSQNTVFIEDEVTLPHVEFCGNNNTISVPEYLMFRVTEIGQGNKVVRRPAAYEPGAEPGPLFAPPTTAPATPKAAGPDEKPPGEGAPKQPGETDTTDLPHD